MGAGAGSSPPEHRNSNQAKAKAYLWFQRNGSKLVATDIICIVLLFILYLLPSRLPLFIDESVNGIQIAAIVLVSFIAISVIWKGIVPGVICVLGIVLIHNSVILPYYSEPQPGEASFGEVKFTWTLYTPTAVSTGAGLNFFLGVSMITFSIIMAYRPSLLFTRNRPDSVDSEWLKYPLWQDNTVLADGRTEYSVPIKRLMTDQDRYILWRYEYILANIYGIPHLVRPEGYVPKYSTSIHRDRESGRMMGKARYVGFFI
ncbi:MAG TPA: hypothetical protein VKB06_01800 [Nitrososphaera sp.]|nr:hypothetical protein [Nitrososphaera sp.]